MKFTVLLMVGLCSTFLPAAEGLKCYMENLDGPKGMKKEITCGETSTAKYLKGLQAKPKGDGVMNIRSKPLISLGTNLQRFDEENGTVIGVDGTTIADQPTESKPPSDSSDSLTFYCYTATMKDNKTRMDRGCKSNKNIDDCMTNVQSSMYDCTVCETDLCNSASIVLPVQAGLISVSILAKLFFQAI